MLLTKGLTKRRHIASLEAFLPEDSQIRNIINWCDLHPIDSWKYWEDGYGNFLRVTDSKNIVTGYKEPEEKTTSDIFLNAKLGDILRHSIKMIITTFESGNKLYWLFGEDNYIRLVLLKKSGETIDYSPLIFGYNILRKIVDILANKRKVIIKLRYPENEFIYGNNESVMSYIKRIRS